METPQPAEPSINPSFLLRAVRAFLAAVAGPAAGEDEPAAAADGAGQQGPSVPQDGAAVASTPQQQAPWASPASDPGPPCSPPAAAPAADADADAANGEEPLGWEEAGCLVWDVAALPDDAAFLLSHDLPAMLAPLLTAAAAKEQWRVLEIGLGVLGNLACHAPAKTLLLGQPQLPPLLLDTLLWVDDAAALAELCRCLASVLADAEPAAAAPWWALLLREETLGRLAWVVENTLSPTLLQRT